MYPHLYVILKQVKVIKGDDIKLKCGYIKIRRLKRDRIYPFKPIGSGMDRSINIKVSKNKIKNIPLLKNGKPIKFILSNRIEYLSQYPVTKYLYGSIEDKECIYPTPNYEILYKITMKINSDINSELNDIRSEMNKILNVVIDQSKLINKMKEALDENTSFIDNKKYEEERIMEERARKRRREKFEEDNKNKTDIEKMYNEWLWRFIES